MFAGPVRDPDGDLVWEFAPVQTTSYRLHYAGEFGEFETRVEVAPRLELELEAGAGAQERVSVCVRAYASTALRGVTVTLQRRTAGSGWEPLRTLTLDRSLSAVAQVALGSSDVELRVRVPTTLRHASATNSAANSRSAALAAAVLAVRPALRIANRRWRRAAEESTDPCESIGW
jgi:hypothetical protein